MKFPEVPKTGRIGAVPRNPATLAENVTENVVQIISRDLTFHLREPIDLETGREHGHFIIAYPPLNIDVYGDDETEAIEAFAEAFGDVWRYLKLEDRQLTQDAVELKNRFERVVRAVTKTAPAE
jgi:high-affinity Fe2+/Pb2+ permease